MSLTLVGLMWVLPFLHYRHQYPLTTFDQEWWSALLGVLALTLLVGSHYWRKPEIPRIVQLPAALIILVLLQSLMGMMAYFDQALLYLLYLLFALLLMMLGARLRECIGLEKLAIVLAFFLLAGAELSALIGVLQHYRWHTWLDSVIVVKVAAATYGNLAQPNHFANYISLGLISLGLLYQQRKWPAGLVALLVIPLLFVMTVSGSRSSWLYLVLMAALAGWSCRRMPELRPLLYYSLTLLAGYVLMHGVVQLPFMKGEGRSYDVMHRVLADAASGDIRLYLWHETWLIFKESPWLGAGFGQFAWQHFQLGPVLRQTSIVGLYNNAHNLIFQFAAEAGVAGLTVLFTGIGLWLNGIRRAAMSAARWWGYAILGVLAIHSLLEYPLWYVYFLAVAAILLGALDETRYRLELRNIGRMSVATMLLLGFLSLLQLKSGYQLLKDTLAIRPASGNVSAAFERTRDGLVAVHGNSLLLPLSELFLSSYAQVNEDRLETKLALNTRVIRFVPIAPVVYRQAFLLAQSGQSVQAKQVLEQAIWAFPTDAGAHQELVKLAQKDPAHFSALLEFALKTEQEYASAIHNQ
ncbi:MAG: Wzy polymerase domain-containing protein [Gallionella sp.]|nr:Wzy polymerase domain-containing protein [Gallionella sp.]